MLRKVFGLTILTILAITPKTEAMQASDSVSIASNIDKMVAVRSVIEEGLYKNFNEVGFLRFNDTLFFNLASNSSKNFFIDVRPDYKYLFLGGCDNQCVDLDLSLFTREGLVMVDVFTNKLPVVGYQPNYSEKAVIRVTMAHCLTKTCWGTIIFMRKSMVDDLIRRASR